MLLGSDRRLGVIIVRSCIHLPAPDGGARSMATIDVMTMTDGSNIVAIFDQWGAIQLLLALLL